MRPPSLVLTLSVDVDFESLYFFFYFLVRLSGPMGASVRPYGKAIYRCTHSLSGACRASRLEVPWLSVRPARAQRFSCRARSAS